MSQQSSSTQNKSMSIKRQSCKLDPIPEIPKSESTVTTNMDPALIEDYLSESDTTSNINYNDLDE